MYCFKSEIDLPKRCSLVVWCCQGGWAEGHRFERLSLDKRREDSGQGVTCRVWDIALGKPIIYSWQITGERLAVCAANRRQDKSLGAVDLD